MMRWKCVELGDDDAERGRGGRRVMAAAPYWLPIHLVRSSINSKIKALRENPQHSVVTINRPLSVRLMC